ncbi:MAG: ATP-binding protein, partial [Peptococcaceae bacterium]|nr:ATP-binding protein [Peptococcaceae bacterium]
MSDALYLTDKNGELMEGAVAVAKSPAPAYADLRDQLAEARGLVEDIVLKNYLRKLTDLEVAPLDDSMRRISDVRLFRITEMVYQKNEYSPYKFASVFNAVQNLDCGVFIIADSDGRKTDFYMGVRSLDDRRTTKSLRETLRNALRGQFPGVKTGPDLLDAEAAKFLDGLPSKNIAVVSCVAKNKDAELKDNERFVQGLEKLALAMGGQRYTAIVLARSVPAERLAATRRAYESIYTGLSPFESEQVSYGANTAWSVSEAFSKGTTTGTSHSTNTSTQTSESVSDSVTEQDDFSSAAKILTAAAAIAAVPVTGGASLMAAGAIVSAIPTTSRTRGTSDSRSLSTGESKSVNEGESENRSNTQGVTSTASDNLQLTARNKTLTNIMERIDLQLKRLDECEAVGMWECAAYFLSDSRETTEMAAGTYKALMRGENSGVETSAINFWGRLDKDRRDTLRGYITNLLHPVFAYPAASTAYPVTPATLVSGNELAIHMGLPRKSVRGFPVIERAEFGAEVVRNDRRDDKNFILGRVFNMGGASDTEARLDRDSMTAHTFVTGSTGAGKSNAIYGIISQLRDVYRIPFLVIEPAKGEYKD